MRNNRATGIVAASLAAVVLIGATLWLNRKHFVEPVASAIPQVPRQEIELRDGRLMPKAGGGPFTGVMYEQTSEGQRITEVPVKDGRVHGLARGWHENGKLEVEEPFEDGVSHGIRTRWHSNGNKRNTATIVRGTLDGPYSEWHENGQPAVNMTLVQGQGEGLCETWLRDGQLKSRVTLKAGEPMSPGHLAGNSGPERTEIP